MNDKKVIESKLQILFENQDLLFAVLSSPKKKNEIIKITIRPILKNEKFYYQITEFSHQQALHKNLHPDKAFAWLKDNLFLFKQSLFCTSQADYQLLIGKKENCTFLTKPPTKSKKILPHNRKKNYFLEEGTFYPFLVALDVMNQEGRVYPTKQHKFRQINRFLELITDILPSFGEIKTIRIVDFGCGKAYLTFALYYFLKYIKKFSIQMIGLDLKKEVIELCQNLAKELNYHHDLQFVHGDINSFHINENIDLVVSLHACDTATDAALEKAIRWNAKVIFCVPCCQHELFSQIQQEDLKPLLKHGILKERFSALVTDAARAQLLECLGYKTQVVEFIDLEHTPKNILIRAIKHQTKENQRENLQRYLQFKNTLEINPTLEKLFKVELTI